MNARPRILIADDSEANRTLVVECLKDEPYELLTATDGPGAFALAQTRSLDLILIDYEMPGFDGFEVCRRLRQDRRMRLLPIVVVSGFKDVHHRVAALEAGADDFLFKPVERSELIARVRSLVGLKTVNDRLEDTRQVVFALAKAVEAKDLYTHAHAERVADAACELARHLGQPAAAIDDIRAGALLHDIGKLAVPDEVLSKPGALTPDEFDAVKAHCVVGAGIVAPLESQPTLVDIVRSHHERYDGKGYPDGLRGSSIPLAARIVAVCDSFDAMINDRPYRSAMSQTHAASILFAGRNSQWDAGVVDSFLRNVPAALAGYTNR